MAGRSSDEQVKRCAWDLAVAQTALARVESAKRDLHLRGQAGDFSELELLRELELVDRYEARARSSRNRAVTALRAAQLASYGCVLPSCRSIE